MAGTTMKELERRIGLPQGCDPSAASSAGMARADVMLQPPEHTQIPTRPRLTYCGPILVLTKGSTLVYSRNGQTSSSLTGRTSGLPIELIPSSIAVSLYAALPKGHTGLRPWLAGSDRKSSRNGAWRPERRAGG